MKAARMHEINKPLRIEDIEIPKVNPNEVLVKIKASGICHTDIHFIDGTLSAGYLGNLPLVLGHEPAGVVEEVGENVAEWKKGDRVIPFRYFTCGKCYSCLTGNEEVCYNYIGQIGFNWDGGFAEYFKAPERFLVKLPAEVSFKEGGTLTCAGHTAYHAVRKRANTRAGDTVIVMGAGGVGLEVLQFAKLSGAKVIVADIADEKLKNAEDFGADHTFNTKSEDLPSEVKKITGGIGADIVFDCVCAADSLDKGLKSLRKLGKMIIIGVSSNIPPATATFLLANEIEILGCRSSNRQELIETVGLAAERKIKSIVTRTFKIEQINEALELLKNGKILGRASLEF